MIEIKNKPTYSELRKAPHKYHNEKIFGVDMSRYVASWLIAGGDSDDTDGFILWMMNIPFTNENGETVYISQDDAEDAAWIMSCGKMELEFSAACFLEGWDPEAYYKDELIGP